MAIQKIINLPAPMPTFIFAVGAFCGFFFPVMLYSAIQTVMDRGPSYLIDKLKNVYELMRENVVWAGIGTAMLLGLAFVLKKLVPLMVGIIIGFGIRIILITLGFSEPDFFSYLGFENTPVNQTGV